MDYQNCEIAKDTQRFESHVLYYLKEIVFIPNHLYTQMIQKCVWFLFLLS